MPGNDGCLDSGCCSFLGQANVNRQFPREFPSWSLPIVVATLLAGCGNSYSSAPGQVAATVNGEEIAVHRVRSAGAAATGLATVPGEAAVAALDRLIDQALLAQKASALRLERDAAVQREIEAAKQKILAQTYVDRSIQKQSIDQDDIVAFYRQHPLWFEQRRSYRLNELVASPGPAQLAAFRAKAAAGGRLEELVDWLQARQLPFLTIHSVKFAEQLPDDLLVRIAALKHGQTVLVDNPGSGDSLSVVQLLRAQPAPLSLEAARPFIASRLLDLEREKFARAKARQLRAAASIEYLGPFAEAKQAVSPPGEGAPGKHDNHFLKGFSGLF